jgi:hypothetical protein
MKKMTPKEMVNEVKAATAPKKRGRPKKAENIARDEKLMQLRFFNPLDPKNRKISARDRDNIYSDEEVEVLALFHPNIRAMSRKYTKMAQHSCGGSYKDLIAQLQMRTIELFRKWRTVVLTDKSISSRNGLDAIKYISWHIHRYVIDLARYQRDKIEPARWQIIDDGAVDENHEVQQPQSSLTAETAVTDDREVIEWTASLSTLQKCILEVWDVEKLHERRCSDRDRKNVINTLVRKVKKHLPLVPEDDVRKAIAAFPKM